MDFQTQKFLQEHSDFVLKLKIKAADGSSQVRRVLLPRIVHPTRGVSYDELVGLCVTFTFPESSPENYMVSLTYFDVDEDTITIASTEELIDAIQQFAEKKVLRITTEVKPKAATAKSTAPPAAATATTSGGTDRGTSTREEAPIASPQIKNVLESFVGILSTAVSHLQEGLASPEGNIAPARGATVTITREEPAAHPTEAATSAATGTGGEDVPPAVAPENNNDEEAEGEPQPFIHGRHTCDSCLVTPIVGKRFHAINLPDYDLCEKCHSNYTGKEVKFESVELDRDRAFQTRWLRRREKIQRFEAKRAELANRAGRRFGKGPPGRFARPGTDPAGRRCGGRPGAGGPPCPPPGPHDPVHGPPPFHGFNPDGPPHHIHGPPPCPGMMHHGPPPPHGPHHPPHPHHGPPPPFAPPHGPPHWAHIGPYDMFGGDFMRDSPPSQPYSSDRTSEFDNALKEAIRRSLRDIAPEEAKLFGEKKSSVQDASLSSAVAAPTPAEEKKDVPTDDSDNSVKDEPDIIVEPDEGDEGGMNAEETKAMEEAMETASVDSEKLVAEEEEDQKPAAVTVTRETSNNSKNESFHSEALGSGDVAEAVGQTLDLVANMISDMLYEAEKPAMMKPTPKKQSETESEADADLAKEGSSDASPGAVILEQIPSSAKESAKFDDASEENEWHVVGEDVEGGLLDGDEEIARAAEMLGSALFNSDMKGSTAESHGNMSNLSDSFSVPSTVASISVGPTQRARWSVQLSKLRELGFDDESQCVEILERLQAANIGVESEDDVSVTQVVNIILEQK